MFCGGSYVRVNYNVVGLTVTMFIQQVQNTSQTEAKDSIVVIKPVPQSCKLVSADLHFFCQSAVLIKMDIVPNYIPLIFSIPINQRSRTPLGQCAQKEVEKVSFPQYNSKKEEGPSQDGDYTILTRPLLYD